MGRLGPLTRTDLDPSFVVEEGFTQKKERMGLLYIDWGDPGKILCTYWNNEENTQSTEDACRHIKSGGGKGKWTRDGEE